MGADRDAHGRFLPGRPGGPGRPRRVIEAGHLAAPSRAETPEVRHHIIASSADQASDGDRFPAVSQGAGPCEASTSDGPSVRLAPAPAVIPEAPAKSRPAGPPSEGTSRLPAMVRPPVPAEWGGAPLDGHWRPVIDRLPIAWRHRWENRSEAYQAAGLHKDLAEFLAYRWTVEEIAAVY